MSREFENVFVNPSNDCCMVICSCGEPSHGSVHLSISKGALDIDKWYLRWGAYITITVVPFPTLWGRAKQALGVLMGRPWEGDFEMCHNEATLLGAWLTSHALEAQAVDDERERLRGITKLVEE